MPLPGQHMVQADSRYGNSQRSQRWPAPAQTTPFPASKTDFQAEDVAQADDLLGQVVGLQVKALAILERAEKDDDLRTALMAVREARATMELVAKITGELVHKRESNINVNWRFTIGKGYVDDEPEAAGQGSRVVNGHVVDEIPTRKGK